ncbi:hypothetical protein PPL_07528 [Heterostelium album PN500]|uniref:Uncharacterized protein n=1 Tax=Heterostelium pallidum (strain ATCC 26659 / Pp 5 / PN500) TaxID=670386 RepID=D3BG77_HETP5|nr:hypothetical protein PPL_07528 [Heterostelium album PN500]EFA79669.1 hypothetical protein PPL_07528 [Heterostelium album PN500]|eukprot:XP_020431790.1 hypothetical protein PPL_07528 [Heterostelium album PN500]
MLTSVVVHRIIIDKCWSDKQIMLGASIGTPQQLQQIATLLGQCKMLTELHLESMSLEDPRFEKKWTAPFSALLKAITNCDSLHLPHLLMEIHFTKHYLNQSTGKKDSEYVTINQHMIHSRFGKSGKSTSYLIPNELFKNFQTKQ